MKKIYLNVIVFFLIVMAHSLSGHCQIPCGIYDDHAKVNELLQDVQTIEKAVNMMESLQGRDDVQSSNQMTRWILNKETHAQKIISTIADYFLTQRVKDSQEDYIERLLSHHAVIVFSMKAKQETSLKTVLKLKEAVKKLENYYPPHEH